MRTAWNKIHWSNEMIDFLKQNYQSMTNQELSSALGIKLTSTRTKLYELGLKRMELEYWTPEQVIYLKQNYYKMGDTAIAEYFNANYPKKKGWSKKHIEKKRRQLGIFRNQLQIKNIMLTNEQRYRMAQQKSLQNRKIAKEGEVRIWKGIKVIKVNGKFIHLAPYLYKTNIGAVPQGMVVSFKDGNSLNCTINNLVLKTRKQLAKQNQNPQKTSIGIKAYYQRQKIRWKMGLPSIYDHKIAI